MGYLERLRDIDRLRYLYRLRDLERLRDRWRLRDLERLRDLDKLRYRYLEIARKIEITVIKKHTEIDMFT